MVKRGASLQHTRAFEEREVETRLEGDITLAEVFLRQGALDAAEQQARVALEEAQKYGLVWLELGTQHFWGTILLASGKPEEGAILFNQALEDLRSRGMRLEYGRALRNYGTVLLQRSSPEEAPYQQRRSYLEQALEIFIECHARLEAEGVARFLNK